ncbi:MAG: DUF1566 domain-containing protein [Chitinophagaceae bacterium]|nr:DUF1566 domain-containing protein [Rubrivivax sp.]
MRQKVIKFHRRRSLTSTLSQQAQGEIDELHAKAMDARSGRHGLECDIGVCSEGTAVVNPDSTDLVLERSMKSNSWGRQLATFATVLVLTTQAHAGPVSGQGTWESTLSGRDINRNAVAATSASAVYLYDSALGVTWLRNANASGERDWASALQWASDLVTGSGASQVSDWRLPTLTATDASVCNFAFVATNCGYNVDTGTSELAYLFHVELGNLSRFDAAGDERLFGAGLTNTGSFNNLQAAGYWLANPLDADVAWRFDTFDGVQDVTFKTLPFYALAVRTGDVLAVPEPQTILLVSAALACMGLITRRRQVAGA